ncbi:MAG: cytosine permease [Chitinophagales bacterium]|nr:cytosine permease [Hyphomicrobiales bacterium]
MAAEKPPQALPLSTEVNADKQAWPLLRAERTWSAWQLYIALTAAAAATWCYIIGEYVGFYLNFPRGFAALLAGGMIGMLLATLAVVPVCMRFGVDSIATTKPQFGSKGWMLPAILQLLSIIGWNSILLIFFGKSVAQLSIAVGILDEGQTAPVVSGAALFACSVVFLILLGGARNIERVTKVLVLHVFAGLWMLYLLVSTRWPELVNATPSAAMPDKFYNFTTGVEIGLVSLLSWWPYIGAMVRMAPDGRSAALPVMLGMGAPVPLLSLIGLAGVLVLQSSDPAQWLRTVGGPTYGVIALLFVGAANLGTTMAGIYASAIGLRHIPGLERLGWPWLLFITILPVALVGLLIPELFFASFGMFLAFIGVGFAPLCGIQITDYYVLRRGRVDVRGLFEDKPQSAYRYWGGFNIAALIAMAAGVMIYLYLLNPVTYEARWPYQFVTASLPSALGAAIVYWVVTRLLVIPAGHGAYRKL